MHYIMLIILFLIMITIVIVIIIFTLTHMVLYPVMYLISSALNINGQVAFRKVNTRG